MNKVSEKSLQRFKEFYLDRNNWRPPTHEAVCKFMGWKSRASVQYALKQLNGSLSYQGNNMQPYRQLTRDEADNVAIGMKLNFGDGALCEVSGFTETTYLVNGKRERLVELRKEDGTLSSVYPHVLMGATQDSMDKDISKCQYCGKLRDKSDIKQDYIISPNWKHNGHRSPPRNYCRDSGCASFDQMAHEG